MFRAVIRIKSDRPFSDFNIGGYIIRYEEKDYLIDWREFCGGFDDNNIGVFSLKDFDRDYFEFGGAEYSESLVRDVFKHGIITEVYGVAYDENENEVPGKIKLLNFWVKLDDDEVIPVDILPEVLDWTQIP